MEHAEAPSQAISSANLRGFAWGETLGKRQAICGPHRGLWHGRGGGLRASVSLAANRLTEPEGGIEGESEGGSPCLGAKVRQP